MIQDYIDYLKEKGMAENTISSYTNDLKTFLFELNLLPTDYVNATDIRKWIESMLNGTDSKALATATINRRLNSLRRFYSWATKAGQLQHNPMQEIQDLKSADEDQEKIMWLTEHEFEDLLQLMRKKPVKSRAADFQYIVCGITGLAYI